jgi:nucleoside-diphosphate-sugar epimerase
MMVDLHLLGGSGRIGRALLDSLISQPVPNLRAVRIYCDSTKVPELGRHYQSVASPVVLASGYSGFDSSVLVCNREAAKDAGIRHIVINLRGVNNKQQWLNQPLDALELQSNSCRALIDANIWMQSGVEIIHLSSQLCDLIESPRSLDEICEGQESYRRPYMVSRLHQEMMLSANAYQHSILTSFLRLPAVYGFADDQHSPWVLNSFCKARRRGMPVQPRNPDRIVYLTHREPLLACLRSLITSPNHGFRERTVNYIRPPMLRLPVESLATIVRRFPHVLSFSEIENLNISLVGDTGFCSTAIESHLQLLLSSVEELLPNG